jgi:hypothetical protein
VIRDSLSPLGKVDTIIVSFGETLGACAGTSGWSVGVPGGSGYILASVAKGTTSVTLTLTQGSLPAKAATGFAIPSMF